MTIVVDWQLAGAAVAMAVALLLSRGVMFFGVLVAAYGAMAHWPLLIALGAFWSWVASPPPDDDGGGGDGRPRHA